MQLLRNPSVVRHESRQLAHIPQVFAAVAGCALLGCLPVGNPPAGQQVFAGRTLTGVFLSPSEKDSVPSYLFAAGPLRMPPIDNSRDSQPTLADLYAFPGANPVATADGLADMQPVASNVYIPYENPVGLTFSTDILGRLLFAEFNPVTPQTSELEVWRFDPSSGSGAFLAEAYFSNGELFTLSPGRTRGFVNYYGSGTVFELESRQNLDPFLSVGNAVFVGEDFYYLVYEFEGTSSSGTSIYRIKPNAQPEILLSSSGSISFEPIVSDQPPQLLLSLATDAGYNAFALLDTETLNTTSLPPEKGWAGFVSVSSDRHWLAFSAPVSMGDATQPSDHRLFLYDWTSGAYATLDSARVGQGIGTDIEWRPGSDELWISTLPDGLAIWRPDTDLKKGIQATLYSYPRAPDGKQSAFTRDGRHWFSTDRGDRPTISVGASDDPTAARWPLNPRGTVTTSHWETDDGRLLVGAWTIDVNRKDMYLIDPDAGTSRAIASAGHMVALGSTRALALLNWEISRATGDLTLIDLPSGEKTVLAEDVYAVAMDRGKSADVLPGTDALAPGTRVAYLTNNRLASPWDGLWVASLP